MTVKKTTTKKTKAAPRLPSMLDMIVELLPGHVYWTDAGGVVLGCNQLFAKSLGYTKTEELLHRSLNELLAPSDAQQILQMNKYVMTHKNLYSAEEMLTFPKDGKRIFLSQRVPLLNKKKEAQGVLCAAFDITERKKLEVESKKMREELVAAKRRAEQRFEKILALMPGHIYWKDKQGRYLGCNEQQAKAAGLKSREEIVGKTIDELPWANHSAILKKSDSDILSAQKTTVVEELPLRVNEEDRIYLSQKGPLYDEDNKITGIIGLSVDITERKRMEQSLNQAKEHAESTTIAKSDFIANMSHDLRTPLHALMGMAEMLREHRCYPEQEEFINNIYQSGKTLLALVEDILNFSKLEANQFELQIQPIDLKEITSSILSTFSHQAKEKGIRLAQDYDEKIPKYLASDPEPIRRIFLNLLINALKFTSEGQIILRVSLGKIENGSAHLLFAVEDTGTGISDENLKKIFNRFYKVDPADVQQNSRYKGTGLGLSIAKQMVEAMGGELQVKSVMGKGSTFFFSLPFVILENAPTPIADNNADTTSFFHKKILLVEDDFLAQRVSVSILEELGCKVEVASSGAEALRKMQSKPFDLIFMDIGLPDQDGLSVTKLARKMDGPNKNAIIYALTAHASEQDAEVCKNAGMNGFLVKPAMMNSFKKVLLENNK